MDQILTILIVLHPLGIFFLFFSFLVRKIPFAGIELTSQRVRGLRGTSELPGRPDLIKISCTSAICLEEQFPGIRDSQETCNTITT